MGLLKIILRCCIPVQAPMKQNEFNLRVNKKNRPIVVDIWAPWCGPCRAMEPAFKQISQKYAGQVEVLKVNADESPEVVKALRVMGIPTVISFGGGKEILRRTGMQPIEMLDILFEAALHQRKPAVIPLSPNDRLFRSVAGVALLFSGWIFGHSLVLMGVGGGLIFSAFYDRIPIYKTIAARVVAIFQRLK